MNEIAGTWVSTRAFSSYQSSSTGIPSSRRTCTGSKPGLRRQSVGGSVGLCFWGDQIGSAGKHQIGSAGKHQIGSDWECRDQIGSAGKHDINLATWRWTDLSSKRCCQWIVRLFWTPKNVAIRWEKFTCSIFFSWHELLLFRSRLTSAASCAQNSCLPVNVSAEQHALWRGCLLVDDRADQIFL